MNRFQFSLVILSALSILVENSQILGDEIEGVAGTLLRVEKNKENADRKERVSTSVGDVIEIEWTYAVVPGEIPTRISSKSDKPEVVKHSENRTVVVHELIGAARVGAFFEAKQKGVATLTIAIQTSNPGDHGVILKCEVTVN